MRPVFKFVAFVGRSMLLGALTVFMLIAAIIAILAILGVGLAFLTFFGWIVVLSGMWLMSHDPDILRYLGQAFLITILVAATMQIVVGGATGFVKKLLSKPKPLARREQAMKTASFERRPIRKSYSSHRFLKS